MNSYSFEFLFAFALYICVMVGIGIFFYRRTQNMSDYILGGRKLGAWVTSMSAEASDMSGWMLMGLPGLAYIAGLNAGWIALGLILGTWANWKFIASRLRKYTEIANDSLTLPDYMQNRFHDTGVTLRVVAAIFILIFFLIYTSSGFVASGKLFTTIWGIDYTWALVLGAVLVVSYTFIGGFMAVCWTDFIQGIMMFFAIVAVPTAALWALGGIEPTTASLMATHADFFDPFTHGEHTTSAIEIISSLAWGLGYLGQPHILVRFMAIHSANEIKRATQIAMTWVIISLSASVLVGMIGRVYVSPELTGADIEKVFMVMANSLFSSFPAGLIMSAVLAAIMSTASAQLLVSASAFSQDFYKALFNKNASQKHLVRVSRITVVTIAALAVMIAMNPNSFVLSMVAYAWAGFGASFGPLILLSLFWRNMTRAGALAGIVVGGVTVLIWQQFAWFGLYEIVPGFFFSLLAIIVVSKLSGKPSQAVLDDFDRFKKA